MILKNMQITWFTVLKIHAFGKTYIKAFKNKLSFYITIITSFQILNFSIGSIIKNCITLWILI